jgi:hypothetical protein
MRQATFPLHGSRIEGRCLSSRSEAVYQKH